MKICIVGEFSRELNEGVKNINCFLSRELQRDNDVLKLDVTKALSFRFWKRLHAFKPDVIHCVSGPSLKSFVLLKCAYYAAANKSAKTVMSAVHPYFFTLLRNPLTRALVLILKPDLLLTQSQRALRKLKGLSLHAAYLPNGVDTEKFDEAPISVKNALRTEYGIDHDKFVILHVGHLIQGRNLKALRDLQHGDNQVLVVASAHFETDAEVRNALVESGCLVWQDYFEHVEDIYALSDCYVFPVLRGATIFSPLSVLEAMSCNLPVVSTKHETLLTSFREGGGLLFVEQDRDIPKAVAEIKTHSIDVDTRTKVLPYSWQSITTTLEGLYESLRRAQEGAASP
jgi:glycosyltransferase involved in cell wall biosynthesis